MIFNPYWLNINDMLPEISLNILDIANNSIRAGANLIEIEIRIHKDTNKLLLIITDNGSGMNKDMMANVEDPFFTSRTTRNIGLGIPFLKSAALITGGSFNIESEPGEGTKISAEFVLSHIDCMPLGDISSTIYALIISNAQIDFIYTYKLDNKSFQLDTRQFRNILGSIPLDVPEVSAYIMEYLIENHKMVNGDFHV